VSIVIGLCCEQGRRKSSPAERKRRSTVLSGRAARAHQAESESSESSDTDDASVSPTALSVSSEDTSDDDDDDYDDSRRHVGGGVAATSSRSVDEAAATYGVRQHSNTTRSPRQTSCSTPSALRLKIKRRIVSGARAPKRDRSTALRKTQLTGKKMKGKVRGKIAEGKTASVVGSLEVKRCRPVHWSPVHSARPADVWLPPPGVRSLMDKVSITDVTANTLTVTVRECTTGEGFFRRSADTEPPTAATSSGSTPADAT